MSKGYKELGPLGLKVLQKLCSESPLLVPRPGVYSFARANPFVEKKNKRQTQASAFETMISSILYCFILSMQCLMLLLLLFAIHGLFLETKLCQNVSGSKVTSGAPNGKF